MQKANRKHLITLFALPLAAGLVLTILAPLGTHRFAFGTRAFFWLGLCLAGGSGAGIFDFLNRKLTLTKKNWLIAVGQSVVSTLAVAGFLFVIYRPQSLLSAVVTLFYIWVIAIVISGIGALLRSKNAPPPTAVDVRPALYDRLPPKLRRAEIYAIASEDHYVRVYTSAGEELILMRLSDAVKETTPLLGLAPHRSWWVAELGVESVKRKGGKTSLALKNGITAPVSRSGAKAVKEAGWV
ncbi:LytTR family transcriptional regulator DNA-binding domain-containing protein [Hellea sp.]|nr:LytTR family transcriptional regulator DNA-binding domain-containing protein [Hellea sp.]